MCTETVSVTHSAPQPETIAHPHGRRLFFRARLSNFVGLSRILHLLLAAVLAMALLLPFGVCAITPDTVAVPAGVETIPYGTSGQGRPLNAYRFGHGENILVLTFAMHGFEDGWDRDGEALLYTANEVMQDLYRNAALLVDYDWSVYVLPCLNPDGLLGGYTGNGYGRCTSSGVDMNRSFPYKWAPYTSARNYNGDAPLACPESQALASFLQTLHGSGVKLLVDTHGWTSQILTVSEQDNLYRIFHGQFPGNHYAPLSNTAGFLSAYAAYTLGYEACLLELPWGPASMAEFVQSGDSSRFCTAVRTILQSYGSNNHHSAQCASRQYQDVSPLMWYHEAVDFVVSQGLMQGVNGTSFAPDQPATRAMAIVLLWRMAGSPDPLLQTDFTLPGKTGSDTLLLAGPAAGDLLEPLTATGESSPLATGYLDVAEDSWYAPAILWANHHQLLPESDSSYFHPDSPISRQDLITMFYRYARMQGVSASSEDRLSAANAAQVQPYAVEAMAWASQLGILRTTVQNGQPLLRPAASASRAELAVILQRTANYF